ncbi:membrane cofactor protein-like isoform X6 [Molossus molossus]|uniref:membrane cofactor protein-like isoform X6 n=1 Tax=Molossus molossus TaxID=27622 RepID=UPI001747BC06|nr:membrane cofactor protein-like isoform X6 [Molossus molossus]
MLAVFRKMTASCVTRTIPPRRRESPFSSWSFVGILLVAPMLLLPSTTDACDAPPRFNTMKIKGNPPTSYNPGDKVEYECRLGFRIIVPPLPTSTVCQADNTWTPTLQEACTRKSCPQPPDPINGQKEGSFEYGSELRFSCNEGYYLLGSPVLRCEISSGNTVAWNDEPPRCEKILCQPPKQIANGTYSNSHKDTFEYSEVVTYSCNPSSGPDKYSLIGESKLICIGQNKWSSDPPECKVVRCPYLTLTNGVLVSGFANKYYYKAEVELACNQGFSLEGSRTIVCGANGTWEPAIPKCVPVLAPPSTKPPILSTSASTSFSTKPPTSSVPGHPTPTGEPPSTALGAGMIILIVICVLGGCSLVIFIIFVFLKKKKKGKSEVSASYSTCQNILQTPAEPTL